MGKPGGLQGKRPGRPIFGLFFHDLPIAVAVTVGTNGFVVGMNGQHLDKCLEKAGVSMDELKELHSWPTSKKLDQKPAK